MLQRYLLGLGCLIFLSGCSSLYFGSYSRIGIDASNPDGAGIGFKTAVLNVTPTRKDGSALSVLGTSDIDMSLTKVVMHERFAVGTAADCAALTKDANVDAAAEIAAAVNAEPQKGGRLLFGTSTSVSLVDLSWADASAQGINFGFKRSTGLKMPVKDDEIGSAYVELKLNNTGTNQNDVEESKTGGIRLQHVFATGRAAIIMASKNSAKLQGLGDDANLGCHIK